MEKAIDRLIRKKLRKTLHYCSKKLNNKAFREAGKYAFALFILINVVSAVGFYVEGSLSEKSAEQALLGFNERLEGARKSFVPEINENIAFLEIAEIELPAFKVPARKNAPVPSIKENYFASEPSALQSAIENLKRIVSESLDGIFSDTAEKTKVALAAAELALFENKIAKNFTVPDVAFLKIVEVELPSLEAALEKRIGLTRSHPNIASDSAALTLQSAIDSVRKIISQTFDRQPQNINERARSEPLPVESALFENQPVLNSNSVRAAQNNLAPSLAPVASSLRNEVARYVELEFAARESVLLSTIRSSMKRQADTDSNRRSVVVNTVTQSGILTNPTITGGTITNASVSVTSLSGAGLANCESNNVLTWANGQFGCETDDTGAGSTPNSKWATSTASDITPNGGGGIIVSASSTLARFVFTHSTGTAATTTNSFATTASSTNLFATALNAGNSTLGNITSGTINSQTISSTASFTGTLTVTSGLTTLSNLLLSGSTTLQNFTYVRATGTAATTTNSFATTASSTNLFATVLNAGNSTLGAITSGTINSQTISSAASFTGTLSVASGLTTLSTLRATASSTIGGGTTSTGLTIAGQATTTNLLVTSSTTLQTFSFSNATGTNIFTTTASSTNLFAGGTVQFAGLVATTTAGSSVCFGAQTGASRGLISQTNGTTACGALSSQRFKFDINSLGEESGLAEVMALRPVSYKYTPSFLGSLVDNSNWSGTFVGFIAEEIAEVDERLIERDDQGLPRAVQYDKITAILARATQEITTTLGIEPGTSEEEYQSVAASSYFAKIWRAIGDKLANASSALDRIFAKRFEATEMICINNTCINEEQLIAILAEYAEENNFTPVPEPEPQPEPEPEPTSPPDPLEPEELGGEEEESEAVQPTESPVEPELNEEPSEEVAIE